MFADRPDGDEFIARQYVASYALATLDVVTASPTTARRSKRAEFDAAMDEFAAAVKRARGSALREIENEGLSFSQFQLLHGFHSEPDKPMSVKALAEAAGVAQPTATRTLDALERAGVVERRPSSEDRRSVEVRLTKRGRELIARKRELVAKRRDYIWKRLDPEDRERAAELLRTMAAAMEEDL